MREHAAWYATQRSGVLAALRASGLRYVEPDGAFYVCVQLQHGHDSVAAALTLVEERGVVAIPGTIAIGLFGAAAAIPENVLLELQNVYAARNSTFAANTLYDSTYTYLPERNVKNTTLGYNLYQSNAFGVCK